MLDETPPSKHTRCARIYGCPTFVLTIKRNVANNGRLGSIFLIIIWKITDNYGIVKLFGHISVTVALIVKSSLLLGNFTIRNLIFSPIQYMLQWFIVVIQFFTILIMKFYFTIAETGLKIQENDIRDLYGSWGHSRPEIWKSRQNTVLLLWRPAVRQYNTLYRHRRNKVSPNDSIKSVCTFSPATDIFPITCEIMSPSRPSRLTILTNQQFLDFGRKKCATVKIIFSSNKRQYILVLVGLAIMW